MIKFQAMRPGAWLREDIADILSALTVNATDGSYLAALRDAATALGLHEQQMARNSRAVVMIDAPGLEVAR